MHLTFSQLQAAPSCGPSHAEASAPLPRAKAQIKAPQGWTWATLQDDTGQLGISCEAAAQNDGEFACMACVLCLDPVTHGRRCCHEPGPRISKLLFLFDVQYYPVVDLLRCFVHSPLSRSLANASYICTTQTSSKQVKDARSLTVLSWDKTGARQVT